MNKIVKNYIYNVIYNVFVLIIPLITAPYLARVLGASRLGIYSYVNSATSIISSITLIGLSSYGSRQVAYEREDKDKLSKIFADLMGLRLFLGVLGTIVYLTYAGFTDYQYYFALFYIYYLGNVVDCTWLFVGVEEMKIPSLKNILVKVIALVGIFLFVKTKDDLWKYVFLLAIANFIGMISTYPQLRKYIKLKVPDIRAFWKYYRGALILFLPALVSTIYLQVDKVMIEWITHETTQVSFYDQAEKIVTIPLTFITVLSTVMMPRIANEFSHENIDKIEGLLVQACRASLLMAFPLMFGAMAIADNFIPWYLGDEFYATSLALKILSPIVLSNTLVGISGTQYFIATNQTEVLLKSNIMAAIMNVIINAIFIPKMGYVGAAVATLISNYTLVFVQYHALSRQINVRKMFKGVSKYFFAAIVMYGVVFIIGINFNAIPIVTLVQMLVGILIYFFVLLISKDDLLFHLIKQVGQYMKR